jgi:hypothetical protein
MQFSLGGAARAVGLHKATLHRAIKSGKLSAIRNADGTYSIDPSELARVYGRVDPATGAATSPRNDPNPSEATPAPPRDGADPALVAELRAALARERETVDDLRATVSRLLAALPAPAATPAVVVTPAPAAVVQPVPPASPPVPRGSLLGWWRARDRR